MTAAVVTVSVGVAIIRPSLEHSPDGAVQLADQAMYAAKSAGRDQSVTLDSEVEHVPTGAFQTFNVRSAN